MKRIYLNSLSLEIIFKAILSNISTFEVNNSSNNSLPSSIFNFKPLYNNFTNRFIPKLVSIFLSFIFSILYLEKIYLFSFLIASFFYISTILFTNFKEHKLKISSLYSENI